jgi:hypothetical protein
MEMREHLFSALIGVFDRRQKTGEKLFAKSDLAMGKICNDNRGVNLTRFPFNS